MADPRTRMSAEAVRNATGKTWNEWFMFLDSERAYDLDHKAIVAILENYIGSIWWRQTVSVEYEKVHGLRVTGETASGSFQVGAQKILPLAPKKVWELLVSRQGISSWLGQGAKPDPQKGDNFSTRDGVTGEFRVVKKMSHLRLSWKPPGWEETSTLQVRVIPKGPGKTVISFHHEGLPGAREREAMRLRWKQALQALGEIAGR